jgi:hypothetical protein
VREDGSRHPLPPLHPRVVKQSGHPLASGRDGKGRRRRCPEDLAPVVRASTTLPQHHSRHVCPLLRWQKFRFRSGLLTMPPAGLEPATRCLEGASTCCGLLPPVAQPARRAMGRTWPLRSAAVCRFHRASTLILLLFTQSDSEVSERAAHLPFVRCGTGAVRKRALPLMPQSGSACSTAQLQSRTAQGSLRSFSLAWRSASAAALQSQRSSASKGPSRASPNSSCSSPSA